ncbi:MAG: type I-E CRISPR-associated protein Cas6/Cse3/CasE [Desulfomonilaceae bacterium]
MSKIKPNLENMSASQLFKVIGETPYSVHQTLWKIFGDVSRVDRDFIYRTEYLPNEPIHLVVSGTPPSGRSNSWTIETKKYEPFLKNGMPFDFMLRANPTVTKKSSETGKYSRHDVVMDFKTGQKFRNIYGQEDPTKSQLVQDACYKWLEKRSLSNGFELVRTSVIADSYIQHKFYKSGTGKPIQISTVDFRGTLIVSDSNLFREALYKGIGPAKSFGCGLLMIRRCTSC